MPGEFVVAAEKKLKKVPYAADYLEIKDLCKKVLDAGQYDYKSFPDLSYTAWIVSEKVNQEKSVEKAKRLPKQNFSNGLCHYYRHYVIWEDLRHQ